MIEKFKNLSKKNKIITISIICLALLFIIYMIFSFTYKYKGDVHIEPKALNPILLSFGNFEIRWYAIFVVGGACLLSVYGYLRYLKPCGLDLDTVLTGVTLGILFGILGGRLYYVLFNHDFIDFSQPFFKVFIEIINPASGGLAIHGALYGASIFIVVYCLIKHIKFLEAIEIVLPVFMLAQVVGRWGNFFNQEAYGPLVKGYTDTILSDAQLIAQRETLRHLLVPNFVVNNMYLTNDYGITGYFHPTFLYEGVLNLIAAVTFIEVRKHSKKLYIGDAIPFYLVCYGGTRLFIELLRQDPLTFTLFGVTFKIAVVTSIAFIVVGIILFILRRVFKFYLVSSKEFLYEGGSLWKEGYTKGGKRIGEEKEERINELVEKPIEKLVIFDCDGTILNTFKMIEKATCQVFDELIPDYKYTIDEIHAFFGPLVDDSFRKYVDEKDLPKVLERYHELCRLYQKDYVTAYPSIKELLTELKLRGYTICILSNKITDAIKLGLEVSGIDMLVDEIYGAEKLTEVKPSPAGIYQIVENHYLDKALIVGDSKYDIQSVNNAKVGLPKVRSVGVTWCMTTREEFESENADYVIDEPLELLKVVENYEKI